jgi:hypothetical protein
MTDARGTTVTFGDLQRAAVGAVRYAVAQVVADDAAWAPTRSTVTRNCRDVLAGRRFQQRLPVR